MGSQEESDKIMLSCELGHSGNGDEKPSEWIPATVPGAVQLDYARAEGYEDYYRGGHFRDYNWMEDRFFTYRSKFPGLEESEGKRLYFVSKGIDYRFDVFLNETLLLSQEGMFSPVSLDLTDLLKDTNTLEIRIHPPPQLEGCARALPAATAKPAVSYGWDWHPRLIPSGIWADTFLEMRSVSHLHSADVKYELNESLDQARIFLEAGGVNLKGCLLKWSLYDAGGKVVASMENRLQDEHVSLDYQLNDPRLWWPHDHGTPYLYRSECSLYSDSGELLDQQARQIGFRRIRLVMAESAWGESQGFPNTMNVSAFQPEVNNRKIFIKGSNFVPPSIFPGTVDSDRYQNIISRALEANFNVLRIWGGGPVQKESFYELCDEAGILVWQDFPLSCYNYIDDKDYLDILEQESASIIHRLRQHPSLAIWCGGNELLNSWSGMTEQSRALRLLNKQCLMLDPETPFIPSSPLYGVAHGGYTFFDRGLDEDVVEKMYRLNRGSEKYTAFAEFGVPSPASMEVLKEIIPDDELWPPVPGSSWEDHHGFRAWDQEKDSWLMLGQLEKYFGKANRLEEVIERGQFLQAEGLKAIYEGARRQKPYCSMALNWCFNEPWPTAANSSIISWPDVPKPSFYAVSESCRPFMLSAEMEKFVWKRGEEFRARLWVLNDRPFASDPLEVKVFIRTGDVETEIFSWKAEGTGENLNLRGPELRYTLPDMAGDRFQLKIACPVNQGLSSVYTLLIRDL